MNTFHSVPFANFHCLICFTEFNCSLSYDNCTGEYYCASANIPDPGSHCSVIIPQKVAPPPNICTEDAFECVSYNPCKAWNKGCFGADPQCTLESEYIQYNDTHPHCNPNNPVPPPKEECLYIDYKCQWYNECAMWLSDTGYRCGTVVEKYRYTHSLPTVTQNSNTSSTVLLPPGECINQLGSCYWSSKHYLSLYFYAFILFSFLVCRSWLDWCQMHWLCGSQYDYEAYFTTPPPPCPPPPQNYTPPAQPGVCQFDLTSGHCQYHYSLTGEFKQ